MKEEENKIPSKPSTPANMSEGRFEIRQATRSTLVLSENQKKSRSYANVGIN